MMFCFTLKNPKAKLINKIKKHLDYRIWKIIIKIKKYLTHLYFRRSIKAILRKMMRT